MKKLRIKQRGIPMKKFVGILMVLFVITTFRGYTEQQTLPETNRFKVLVAVECDDENTKTLIESYINRELRSLGDVLIASQDMFPTHRLQIIAIELTKGVTKHKTGGIAISTTCIESILSIHDPVIAGHLSSETRKIIAKNIVENMKTDKTWWAPINIYRDGFLNVGDIDQLSDHCKSLVATFDIHVLEVARERK